MICLMKSVVTRDIGHLCPVVGHSPLLLNVIRSCLAYHTWILRNSFNSQKSNPLGQITRIIFIVNYLESTVLNILFLTM